MNDNRVTGSFENSRNLSIVQGDSNSVTQTYAENEIDDIFQKWINEIKTHSEITEKESNIKDIEDIKECVKNNKFDIAKKLFKLLEVAINTTSSAMTIANIFKWV